ncbi:MAG: PilZ domain-containing protein [Candidatus Eremiobacteraeota bacterium]|nr:PilZ domain-containing protein [Candidatus Eremiobacteraeota bacterium]
MSRSKKDSIPLETDQTPYEKGVQFLVIPADLNVNFTPCTAKVSALDGYSAWLSLTDKKKAAFPKQEEVLLIEFRGRYVYSHRSRITQRRDGKVLVAAPALTEKEESQLAPSTGRHDYRVQVDVPIQIRFLEEKPGSLLRTGKLVDLSRGGMSFFTRDTNPYESNDQINLQVVSWEYPVNIDAEVTRVRPQDDGQVVAVRFSDKMSVRQREMVSAFIIQVQRRDALSRDLPSEP